MIKFVHNDSYFNEDFFEVKIINLCSRLKLLTCASNWKTVGFEGEKKSNDLFNPLFIYLVLVKIRIYSF